MGKVMRHTLGASLNIRHNLSSSKGPKPLQLKLLTTYIPKTSAFTLAFSTSQRLRTTRASARTFFTFRHYITPSARFFFSSRRRHTISKRDWSSDVCSSDLCFSWGARSLPQAGPRTDERPHPFPAGRRGPASPEIGRASCRERVLVSGAAQSLKKKRASGRTFLTFRHYITPYERNL